MPAIAPPADGLSRPAHQEVLPAGTRVWRIHTSVRDADAPNPTVPKPGTGGRFDSDDGTYAHLYLGDSREAAIAETLRRDLRLDGTPRFVAAITLRGKLLTALDVLEDIPVAALHGPHLAAIGQDLWLTKSDAEDYPLTRRWAAAIFAATPVGGLAYRCRHDEDRLAWMLTTAPEARRHASLRIVADSHIRLDSATGLALVSSVLDDHSAALSTR